MAAANEFMAMADAFLNSAETAKPPENLTVDVQPTDIAVGQAPWWRTADPRIAPDERVVEPPLLVPEVVQLLQDWSEHERNKLPVAESQNRWHPGAASSSNAQAAEAEHAWWQQDSWQPHGIQGTAVPDRIWDDETTAARELGIPWKHRGPERPQGPEQDQFWKQQRWREGSGRYANRGGKNRCWWSCFYSAVQSGASKKDATDHANKMHPRTD